MNSTKHRGAVARGRAAGARGGSRGFTLLETVIALCVALVVGFGAISLFIFSVNYNAGASDRARALAIAQQRVETLRSLPYASVSNTNSTVPYDDGSAAAGASDRRTFAVTTVIENTAGVSNSRQKTITVTVRPNDAGRWSSGAVTLRTYRASHEFVTP